MKTNSRLAHQNKTIYVKAEDFETWELAARYIPFFEKKTLSEYVSAHLREYVKEKRKLVKGE